jgi:two-component system, OmpR family, sensor histidine kinase SenX3
MLKSMGVALPRSLVLGVCAVAVLLGVLATLQYRWLGQISEADQARLRTTAKNRAEDLARDFDREITRAFLRLQFDASEARALDATRFVERRARWRTNTTHPGLVQDVWLADETGERLWRFDPQTSRLEPSTWPVALTPMHERIRAAAEALASARAPGAAGPEPSPFFRPGRHWPADLFDDKNLALVSPIPDFDAPAVLRTGEGFVGFSRRLAGYTIVTLDAAYMREQLFPALVRRHFGADDEGQYTLCVTTRKDPLQVIFRTSPAGAVPGAGDASAQLFSLRMEEAGEDDLQAFRIFRPPPPPRGRHESSRHLPKEAPNNSSEPSAVARGAVESSPNGRSETRAFGGARRGGGPPRGEPDGQWNLVATHRAGSVDQVVAAARLRNLGVSAGILALLGVSVVLIVVSAQRARRLAERQLEFVAGVSHELRTPVAVIASAGENLADGIVADREMVEQYGRVVRDEARRLAEMVEQVLDFAGSYAGRRAYRFEDVEVEDVARECLSAIRPALDEAGAVIDSSLEPGLPPLKADRAALRRALLNLLQNAIKYGGDSPRVGLRVTSVRASGRPEVRIAVEDHGLGIAPGDRDRIFEPFVRGEEAQARQIRGSGLGLSLVRRIVEAHSGRISVTSTEGQGSTFVIALPGSATPSADLVSAEEETHGTAHTAG